MLSGKAWNHLFDSTPAVGKIFGQVDLFSLGIATGIREGQLRIQRSFIPLKKIYLVLWWGWKSSINSLTAYIYIYIYIYIWFYRSIYLSISASLSIYQSIYLSSLFYLFTCVYHRINIYLFIYLSSFIYVSCLKCWPL